MKRLLSLFVCSLLVAVGAMAQGWVKPVPQNQDFAIDTELYLWNVEAEGFFLGANDWGTRCSIDSSKGWKVKFDSAASDYYFHIFVEEGGHANQWCEIKIEGETSIWTDAYSTDGNYAESDHCVSVAANGDGSYRFGPSNQNGKFNVADYEGVFIGLDPNRAGDTRLYLVDAAAVSDAQVDWYFVSASTYEEFVPKRLQWEAAMELGEAIAQAEALSGVDASVLSAAKAAYGNTSTSTETLKAQKAALETAMISAATPTAPIEVLSKKGIATDFSDGQATGWESSTSAQNKQASNGNNAANYDITGNHYENWNSVAFGTGKVYATPTGLPKGVYHLNALAFANVTGGTYLYAGNVEKLVTTTNIDINSPMDIYTVGEGSLEVGLEVKTQGPNWIGLDNVFLYNLGSSAEAVNVAVSETLKDVPDPEYYQHSVKDTFDNAKSALESASNIDALASALPAYYTAQAALVASAEAYDKYYQKYLEVEEFYNNNQNLQGEGMIKLGEYLDFDDGPSTDFPNGCAHYILDNGTLNAEQLAQEIKFMTELQGKAVEGGMEDGTDVTAMIKNAHFAETGVWTSNGGSPEWPLGPEDYAVAQCYNTLFNVSQEIVNLQNGLYELTLNDFFRPGSGNENPQTYVYMNDDRVNMNPIDDGGDQPTDVTTAADAFKSGRYEQHLYGIVTDGTMTIKLTNENRFSEDWACWSNLRMTFRASNPTVLAEVTSNNIAAADQLLNQKMGNEQSSALSSAKSAASANTYDALVALKKAMKAASEGIEAYTSLNAALVNLSTTLDEYKTSPKATEAQALLSAADAAYSSGSLNTAAALAKVEELNAMATALKLGDITGEETDMTSVIVNPNMDPAKGNKNEGRIDGWTTTAMNGYKEYIVSYNRSTFHLYQDLSGLPKGKYRVKVHAYYRAGYWYEEEDRINAGNDVHYAKLYAETSQGKEQTNVLTLTEGATTEDVYPDKHYQLSSGLYAPDGTTPTAAWFAAGYYLNELEFSVPADGKVRIGIQSFETVANDYACIGSWELTYLGDDEAQRKDVSNLIVNPNMDPAKGNKNEGRIDGWTTTAMNGYKEYIVSYNRSTFHLYQDLSGLPAGIYEVTAHAYYRAGYWYEEEDRINAGNDVHYAKLYAETSKGKEQTNLLTLTEGATTEDVYPDKHYQLSSGLYAPDGTTPTAAWFAAGYYLNSLQFEVPSDGKARIGIQSFETVANDYACIGEWNLYYLGSATGVEGIQNNKEMPAGFYSLSGVRLNEPQRGINIIKMADGTVRKVLVK